MRRISIIGATFIGNRGAEAMLTATVGRIRERYTDCRFCVFSYYPDDDKLLIHDKDILIYSATPLYIVTILLPFSVLLFLLKWMPVRLRNLLIPDSVKAISNSDVLIDLSGVAFIDGRGKVLLYNVLTLVPSFILGTPVLKFSQALGPFHNPLNRALASLTLSRCRKIFARGRQTLSHLETLQITPVYGSVVADVVFLRKHGDSLSQESLSNVAQSKREINAEKLPIIGICPSSVVAVSMKRHGKDYIGQISDLCRSLLDRNYAVLLFPNATRQADMSRLRNNDLPLIVDVRRRLVSYPASEHLHTITYDLNTDSITGLVRHCSCIIVSRFHAMVTGLQACIPTIVVGWGHKYTEVMASFGLENFVFDFGEFSSTALLPVLDSALSNTVAIKRQIESELKAVKSSSQEQFDYLFKFLERT